MEVDAFILGLTSDLEQRCQRLAGLLTKHELHPDVAEFGRSMFDRLLQTSKQLRALRSSDTTHRRHLWPYALSNYQDLFRDVALVEEIAIPVLLRYDDRDHQCRQWAVALAREVGYPDELMPVVTATSDRYYWTYAGLRVVGVPAGDLGGILGWPDLFHELGHLLLEARPGLLTQFASTVSEHFQRERDLIGDIGGLERDSKWLAIAQIKWGKGLEATWRQELAADTIATYLIGPSYGWQHIRLATNHGSDPYHPSPGDSIVDHPADQARLDAMHAMLRLLGLDDVVQVINKRWMDVVNIGRYGQRPQGYNLYYPQLLLDELAQTVFAGCQVEGLVPFTEHQDHHTDPNAVLLVDRAWQVFNRDPAKYPAWEREAIRDLRSRL